MRQATASGRTGPHPALAVQADDITGAGQHERLAPPVHPLEKDKTMKLALRPSTPTADRIPATGRDATSAGTALTISGADAARTRRTADVHLARKAGLLYLVIAVFGGFAQVVRVRVYAPGDAATTAANLVANASLVRLSFAADLVQALVWLCLALVLHRLLAHAGKYLARAMVMFVVVSVGIASLNMVHQLGALLVVTTPAYATAFGPGGADGVALLLMDLQYNGYLIAQLSWLWLFALGLLGYRSGMFPRPLALVLMLSTVCYVVDALLRFLAPGFADTSATVFLIPEILSEVSLLLYLLIKGVRTPSPASPTAS
jgi:hypothetical protein